MATMRLSSARNNLHCEAQRARIHSRSSRVVCEAAKRDEVSRRNAMVGLALSLPLGMASSALAVSPIEIVDDRRSQPFHRSQDQARDDSAHYSKERFFLKNTDGLSLADQKKRAMESYARLQKDVKDAVDSKTWWLIENDIRHQMGYLRYDLNSLVASLPDAKKAQATAAKNRALRALEQLDLSVKQRNDAKLSTAHAEAVRALGDAVAYLA